MPIWATPSATPSITDNGMFLVSRKRTRKKNVDAMSSSNSFADSNKVLMSANAPKGATTRGAKPSSLRFLRHYFPDLPLLPVGTQPPRQAEHCDGVGDNANSPTEEHPLNPPWAGGHDVHEEQENDDENEYGNVYVKALDRFDPAPGPQIVGIIFHAACLRERPTSLDADVDGRRCQTFDRLRALARAFLPSARRTSSIES